MIKKESDCVNCGLPCLFETCPHYRLENHYCDKCGDYAEYEIEGKKYCNNCAFELAEELLSELSLEEKFEAVNVDIKRIG